MESTLITTILRVNIAIQKLTPADGPTVLIVAYVRLKTLLIDLKQTDPRNSSIVRAIDLLTECRWQEASALLDYYVQDQDEAYQMAYNRIQASVSTAVKALGQD